LLQRKEEGEYFMWDFKFSRRLVWCSELSSGIYCRVKLLSTDGIPDDGGSTYLWNVGQQYFTRQYIPEDNSELEYFV
jgi:hypothetical protein